VCRIHPSAARAADIHDGDAVQVETKQGHMVQTARLTDQIRPDTVLAAYGWWFPEENLKDDESWCRSNYNMLTETKKLGKAFGTPDLKGIPCRIKLKRRAS
jgi:anaerobic selenocysteine-containing dehydrogenase